ncbi:hypothetical protein BDQ12DRAFT_245226 [Crucibulum laeve]|uniref:F-box domain-containing protein n=1 Tax=Crucibulum laeve TaxID=68775 RepID=A0A5C3LUE8_9AGAR|nr:hypothetical protein BDQ12DRAFT_245226 [Crucibulum laeve]
MSSCMETIPRDVLQHIAFLGASASKLDPPSSILHLLLTSSTIYHTLSFDSCPQLYANIFRTKFDIAAPRRRYPTGLTDSAVAAEFKCRCRVLRRARRRDVSDTGMRQDLWTALWMILESDGLNETQLRVAEFPEFVIMSIQSRLGGSASQVPENRDLDIESLLVWLFCLTLSRKEIGSMSLEIRTDLLTILRPFALSMYKLSTPAASCALNIFDSSIVRPGLERSSHKYSIGAAEPLGTGVIINYSRRTTPQCPDPCYAAISLIFALREAKSMEVPVHLPRNRAAAIAAHRSGPTMEDFLAIQNFKTPLFADSFSNNLPESSNSLTDPTRSTKHDLEFSQVLHQRPDLSYTYIPGTLTGIWQGTYMMAAIIPPRTESSSQKPSSPPDLVNRQPMQCALSEYLCFSPYLPIPADDVVNRGLTLRPPLVLEEDFELCSRKYGYEKYTPTSKATSSTQVWRNPDQALDVIITGETLEDHDQAWGGFKFAGRVQRDGMIVLKRAPKNADEDHLGTWVFEGRLCCGVAFVGTWRLSTSFDTSPLHGIFSMERRSKTWDE